MKEQHKTMLTTALFTLLLIAVISNVSALESLKDTINGDDGWF